MNKQRKARPDPIQRWIKSLHTEISYCEGRILEWQERIEIKRELILTLEKVNRESESPYTGPASATGGSSNAKLIK